MLKRFSLTIFLFFALSFVLTAQEATPEATPEETPEVEIEPIRLPSVDPIDVTGDIDIAGSSTVFPLTERIRQRFESDGYSDTISDVSDGTGAGFQAFCIAGSLDIINASRAIRDTELEQCRQINREPLEFRIGTDALVIAVSVENDFLQSVTLEELALIFSTAENWSDINPAYPDEPIVRYVPGTESGTFDYFVERVLDDEADALINASELQLSEDDNVLVRGVESSPYAIGFFGFAYFLENVDFLRAVSIDEVIPDEETVEGGLYPLSRPLYIYSDPAILIEKPQVAAFINYYLTHVNEEILEVGYFPASVEALNESKQTWLEVVGE
jgi:phosphate transport system substrate-binding protein